MLMPGNLGPFKLAPGQVTDDSELAMSMLCGLAGMPAGLFEPLLIGEMYKTWFESRPFDIGNTTRNGF
jgi:hypothetical protein